MTELARAAADRAEALRREFDGSFALAPREESFVRDDVLKIGVGAHTHAVRVAHVAGLFADKRITPVPSPLSELLGITVLRGAIVAVYDLRALLGCPVQGTPRWSILTAGATGIVLAFDRFEGYVRIENASLDASRTPATDASHVSCDGALLPLLHVPALVDSLRERARAASIAAIRSRVRDVREES